MGWGRLMYREYLAMIRQSLDALGIKSAWHSFKNIPSDHCYATYFVPSMEFGGHDLRAEYYDYTVQVTLLFRDYFKAEDTAIETAFEESVRDCGSFSKSCGYDSSNDQFYTEYTFKFKEFFDTE